MLKTYDLTLNEHLTLYKEMCHPDVSPYVRHFTADFKRYLKSIPYIIDAEKRGEMIVRVIFNEWNHPIGMIMLYDIFEQSGFLSTWLGKQYHGKGYNQKVKKLFLDELFHVYGIELIYLKVRIDNYHSQKAIEKLIYAHKVVENNHVMTFINQTDVSYSLYYVTKLSYTTASEQDEEKAFN